MYTNIPGDGGTVRIKIQGEAWQALDVKPRSATFARVTAEEAESGKVRKLTVVNNVEGDANLTDVTSTNPAFKAEVVVLEPGKKFEIIVSMVPPLKQGSNRGKIQITTGIADLPTLNIPVNAYLTAEVDIQPPKLTLRSQRTANETRQIYVRNHSKKPLTITDLEVSNEALTVTIVDRKPESPGKDYRLTVSIPLDYKVPTGGDRITFKTDCPSALTVTIPISERKAALAYAPGKQKPTLNQIRRAAPSQQSAAFMRQTPSTALRRAPGQGLSPSPTAVKNESAPKTPAAGIDKPAKPAADKAAAPASLKDAAD